MGLKTVAQSCSVLVSCSFRVWNRSWLSPAVNWTVSVAPCLGIKNLSGVIVCVSGLTFCLLVFLVVMFSSGFMGVS